MNAFIKIVFLMVSISLFARCQQKFEETPVDQTVIVQSADGTPLAFLMQTAKRISVLVGNKSMSRVEIVGILMLLAMIKQWQSIGFGTKINSLIQMVIAMV
jgi:hypothetical protein